MADITKELQDIQEAVYGEEVRGSIHDAIEKINNVSETTLSTGTLIDSELSPTEGFYEDSLYLNLENQYLWRCTGTSWELIAQLKGIQGERGPKGTSIVSLIDNENGTFSLELSDGTTTNPINLLKGDKGDTGNTGSPGQNGISILNFIDRPTGAIHNIWAQMSDGSERLVGSISDGIVEGGDGDMKKSTYATLDTDNKGIVDKALSLNDGTRNVTIEYVTNKADKATTISGYGITDAYTKAEVDEKIGSGAASWDGVSGKPFSTLGSSFRSLNGALALSTSVEGTLKIVPYTDKWNSTKKYSKNECCIYENASYISLKDNNVGNYPIDEVTGSEVYWKEITIGEKIKDICTDVDNRAKTTASTVRFARTDLKANASMDGATTVTIGSNTGYTSDGHSAGILNIQSVPDDKNATHIGSFKTDSTHNISANRTYYMPNRTGTLLVCDSSSSPLVQKIQITIASIPPKSSTSTYADITSYMPSTPSGYKLMYACLNTWSYGSPLSVTSDGKTLTCIKGTETMTNVKIDYYYLRTDIYKTS